MNYCDKCERDKCEKEKVSTRLFLFWYFTFSSFPLTWYFHITCKILPSCKFNTVENTTLFHWRDNRSCHFPFHRPFTVLFFSLERVWRSIRIKIAGEFVKRRNSRVPDRETKNGNRDLISIQPYYFRFAFSTIVLCFSLPLPTDSHFPSFSYTR